MKPLIFKKQESISHTNETDTGSVLKYVRPGLEWNCRLWPIGFLIMVVLVLLMRPALTVHAKNKSTIRVACCNNPPSYSVDSQGKSDELYVEPLHQIAAKKNLLLEFEYSDWDTRLETLEAGDVVFCWR